MCEPDSSRQATQHEHAVLTHQERQALRALVEARDRVIGRRELSRHIGLTDVNERRCDSLLVGIRRVLGPDSIRTVRGRGWMLAPSALPAALTIVDQNS